MLVCFAHGKESGPWGRKIRALSGAARELGMAVESPDFSFTRDPEERVRHLLSLDLPAGRDLILAGSSMGGYVAAVASRRLRPAGLFLMAPAFYLPGYGQDPVPRSGLVEVVHGWGDDVVPVESSWRFARDHRARLHLCDAGHALTEAMPYVERLFRSFLADRLESVR